MKRVPGIAALLLLLLAAPPLLSAQGAGPAAAGPAVEELWRRGQEALGRDDREGALAAFGEALELDPSRARTWNYIGGIHFAGGDYLKALRHFKEAFSRDPGDALACNNVGTAYEHLDLVKQAETYYLRAIEIDSGYALPYRNLGVLYAEHLQRPKLARTYWERYLDLVPPGPEAERVREALGKLGGGD